MSYDEFIVSFITKIHEIAGNNVPEPVRKTVEVFNTAFDEANVDLQTLSDVETIRQNLFEGAASNVLSNFGSTETIKGYMLDWYRHNNVNVLVRDLDYLINNTYADRFFEDAGTAFLNILDKLDLSKVPVYAIYVHFPHITVTNERDKSVEIDDMYAQTLVCPTGKLSWFERNLTWQRATYDKRQYYAGYKHSHLPSFEARRSNANNYPPTSFKRPCLGSGPINVTMTSLEDDFSEDFWFLYCRELDVAIHTESLEGGPYYKMSEIAAKSNKVVTDRYKQFHFSPTGWRGVSTDYQPIISDIVKQLLQSKVLKFRYAGQIELAMSYAEYMTCISNIAIEYINAHLNTTNIGAFVLGCMFRGYAKADCVEKVYFRSNAQIATYEGSTLLKFKGQDVKLTINRPEGDDVDDRGWFLNNDIAMAILQKIILIVNITYGRTDNFKKGRTHQKQFYL